MMNFRGRLSYSNFIGSFDVDFDESMDIDDFKACLLDVIYSKVQPLVGFDFYVNDLVRLCYEDGCYCVYVIVNDQLLRLFSGDCDIDDAVHRLDVYSL